MADWVLRAGMAEPERLMEGYGEHKGVSGVYGFSVQYAPGKPWEELARAGKLPNGMVSVAYDTALAAAIKPLGYTMRLVKTPGTGYHHTFAVLYDASGAMLQRLPRDAADAISRTFRRERNPHKVKLP